MSATSLTVPVMMIFSFVPMLAMFNETIEKAGKFLYSQQVFLMINGLGNSAPEAETIIILIVNAVLAIGIFLAAYKKKGLEQ